jgi:hypothetical protein
MRDARALIAMAWMLGCGSSDGAGGAGAGPVDAGADGRAADFVAFTTATRVIDHDESGHGSVVLVLTDATGPSACGLGSEGSVPVGAATAVRIEVDTTGGTQCPDGTYSLDVRDGHCASSGLGGLPSDCGIYRRWSTDGTELTTLLAVAGAATLRDEALAGDRRRCHVDLDVQFPGGRVTETFAIDFAGGANPPFCSL